MYMQQHCTFILLYILLTPVNHQGDSPSSLLLHIGVGHIDHDQGEWKQSQCTHKNGEMEQGSKENTSSQTLSYIVRNDGEKEGHKERQAEVEEKYASRGRADPIRGKKGEP